MGGRFIDCGPSVDGTIRRGVAKILAYIHWTQPMMWRVATFAFTGSVFGLLGFWAGERTPPVDVLDATVLTPVVRPGEDLRIKYTVFRRASCRTKFQRTYRDSENARYTLEDIDIWYSPAPLGHDEYVSLVPISSRAQPGAASFRAITVYICNPIHNIWPITQVSAQVPFRIEGEPTTESVETIQRR